MPGPIKSSEPKTNFERLSTDLRADSKNLSEISKRELEGAGASVGRAGESSKDAFESLAGAGVNVAMSGVKLGQGGGQVAGAVGHLATGAGYAVAGAGGWVGEGVLSGARFVARNLAHGFAAIANLLAGKNGPQVTVRDVEGDPNAVRFSDKMFGKAGREVNFAKADAARGWNAWTQSVINAAGAAGNLVRVAGHLAGAAGGLVQAATQTGLAGVAQLARAGVELSSVAVNAAGEGVEGAREVAILSARFSAATANTIGNVDQGKVKVDESVAAQLATFHGELLELSAGKPRLQALIANSALASA